MNSYDFYLHFKNKKYMFYKKLKFFLFFLLGKLEKVNLHEKISEIQKEITKLKYDVKDFMDDNYVEFTSKLTRDQHLVLKGEKLLEEMNALQKRIDDHVCLIKYNIKNIKYKLLKYKLYHVILFILGQNRIIWFHKRIKNSFSSIKRIKYYVTTF